MEKAWFISQIDVFDGIPDAEVMRIAKSAEDQRCASATQLYSPHNGQDRNVFIVKEGEVALYHSVEGKKVIFDVVGPGSLFGNFLPETEAVSHYAEAMPGSRICKLTTDDFQKVLATHPTVLIRLLRQLSARLQDYEQKLHLDSKSAQEKILGELKRYQRKKFNPFSVFKTDIALAITHEKIAELTGVNRVTVTRALKMLKLVGKIEIDQQGRIILL